MKNTYNKKTSNSVSNIQNMSHPNMLVDDHNTSLFLSTDVPSHMRKMVNSWCLATRKWGSCSREAEVRIRDVVSYLNQNINQDITLFELSPNIMKFYTRMCEQIKTFKTDLQIRHEAPEFVYNSGNLINNQDRMRIRMFIGTIETNETIQKEIHTNSEHLLDSSMNRQVPIDVVRYIIGFICPNV